MMLTPACRAAWNNQLRILGIGIAFLRPPGYEGASIPSANGDDDHTTTHKGDLPDLSRCRRARSRSTPRRWASTRIATGSAWCSSRPATAAPTSSRSRTASGRAEPGRACSRDPGVLKIFHYARFDVAVLKHRLRRRHRAGLLHQDRLASWSAPIPTGTASRTWSGSCSASTSASSSRARTGAPTRSARPSSTYAASDVLLPPRPVKREARPPCWCARAAPSWPRPASISCRRRIGLDLAGLGRDRHLRSLRRGLRGRLPGGHHKSTMGRSDSRQ